LGVGSGAKNPSLQKTSLLQNVQKSLGPRRVLWINDLSDNVDMRFGTWNVRCLYRASSLMAVSRELSIYNLDIVGVQEVRWEGGGTEPAGEYTFFSRKGNENHELGAVLSVCIRESCQ
jgi:hypothetical protein